jgi:mono/diheme cytochrome c family protein
MKKINILFSLLIVATLLVAILNGCEGPAGPPGDTTIAGLEGFKEGINCGDCHNPDQDTTYYVWAKKYQWELSKHFYGGDFERNTASCAGCHTTEGFIQSTQGKTVTDHIDASPPGCFACHSPHARGDFSLRTVEPVIMNATVEGQGDAIFDYGKGNLCASCHKPRTLSPMPDPGKTEITDTITITNSRWYPHYGVQSQMLSGNGGFEFLSYTYTGNSNHSTNEAILQEGCVACHMADATAGSGIAGGHTMNIVYLDSHGEDAYLLNGCTTSGCHSVSGFDINYIGSSSFLTGGLGTHTATEAYMDTLHALLLDRNWITESGSINASQNNPLKIAPADKAGALFNYFFIEHDMSKGSHNTRYALELLISSIAELREE